MNQLQGKEILGITSVCFGMGYPFYCWVTHAGFLGWLVDLELTLQGKGPYVVHAGWLMLPTFVLSWVAALALFWPARYVITHLPPPPTAIIQAPRPADGAPTPKAKGSPVPIWFQTGSLLLIVVGVGAGVIAYRKSTEPVAFEVLNLADGVPPGSTHVKLTGLAVPSLKSQYSYVVRTSYELETYIPVVPPNWHHGDPVVFFFGTFRE
jgi:hypothetical protein